MGSNLYVLEVTFNIHISGYCLEWWLPLTIRFILILFFIFKVHKYSVNISTTDRRCRYQYREKKIASATEITCDYFNYLTTTVYEIQPDDGRADSKILVPSIYWI